MWFIVFHPKINGPRKIFQDYPSYNPGQPPLPSASEYGPFDLIARINISKSLSLASCT